MVGPHVWTTKRKNKLYPDGGYKWPSVSSPQLGTGFIPPLIRRAAPSYNLARGPVFGAHYIKERLTVRQLDEVRFGRKVRSSVRTCASALRK